MLDLSKYRGNADLLKELRLGRWLLLLSRNSTPGKRDLAADEVYNAADGLSIQTGIDIHSHLPTKAEIIAGLKRAKPVKSTSDDGTSFTNEYYIIILSEINTIIFVSTGSGSKLNDQYEQPFLQELIGLVKTHKPALVFANRLDRVFRRMLTAPALLNILQATKGALGDSASGIRSGSHMGSLFTIYEAGGSENEVLALPKKLRHGQVNKTDRSMINGSLQYTVPNQTPPGTIRMTLFDNKGALGDKMLYLDDPVCFPQKSTVAVGYPPPLRAGALNNIALIQWALKNLGTPNFSQAVVGQHLAKNGFSTPGIRKTHGVHATFLPTEEAERHYLPVRSIISNLDFYKTGTLKIQMGREEIEDFEITNIFPLSGSWASPEDFERIEKYLSETAGGGPATLSLVGVPVKTEDGSSRLIAAWRRENLDRPAYILHKIDKDQARKGFPPLPHDVLAESIVTALIEAAKTTWIPIESQADQVNPALQNELSKLRTSVERIHRQVSNILDQMLELGLDGEKLLDPGTRQDLGVRRQGIITKQLEPQTKKIEELEDQLFSEMEAHSASTESAPVNLLSELIATLKDSSDTTYNRWWKTALSIDSMQRVLSTRDLHSEYELRWKGTIRITSLSHAFEIPFSGVYLTGAVTKVAERVKDVIKLMGLGVPFDEIKNPQMRSLKPSVARALGMPSQTFNLGTCPDPRILRIGVLIAQNPKLGDAEIAQKTIEAELFIARVRKGLETRPFGSKWVRNESEMRSAWFKIASNNLGVVTQDHLLKVGKESWVQNIYHLRVGSLTKKEWVPISKETAQLVPCAFCNSRLRSSSRMFEPIGYICLDCHLDQAGLLWPSEPYDKWLDINS